MTTVPALVLLPVQIHRLRPTAQIVWMGSVNASGPMNCSDLHACRSRRWCRGQWEDLWLPTLCVEAVHLRPLSLGALERAEGRAGRLDAPAMHPSHAPSSVHAPALHTLRLATRVDVQAIQGAAFDPA